jgi:hypothetical protein
VRLWWAGRVAGGPRRCCEGMSEAYCRMLSTLIRRAPVACRCNDDDGRCCWRGAESRESVMSTVGPRLLFAVGALIVGCRRQWQRAGCIVVVVRLRLQLRL